MEGVVEDDVFFADISKQISLLIMDDDDHHHLQYHHPLPPASFQEFSRGIHPNNTKLPAFCEQTTRRRETKGTGVFIPHNYYSPNIPRRRNNKQASFTSTKSQRHSNNNYSKLPPHHYNTIAPTSFYNSINPNIC